MKTPWLCLFTTFALLAVSLHAADDGLTATLRAADDARVAAMKAADGKQLAAIFSDELTYAHSTGVTDGKASLIQALTTGRTKYATFDYFERNFSFPAPGIALMRGRAHILATATMGPSDTVLSFLGVWREEKGQWKFIAWQSCKIPPAVATSTK